MSKLGPKIFSIRHNRCPRCHVGKFWPYHPYYNLFYNGGKLYESCSHCGLKYYREIGFWYGAMYVAYALSIGVFLCGWAITALTFPETWSTWIQVGVISATIILLMPVNYALSRLIWINLFVKFDPDKIEDFVNPNPGMSEET